MVYGSETIVYICILTWNFNIVDLKIRDKCLGGIFEPEVSDYEYSYYSYSNYSWSKKFWTWSLEVQYRT